MGRPVAAEFLGTGLLLLAIVGSGIVVQDLANDPALALFAHAVAVGATIAVLIAVLAPVSGAHLNPAITLVAWRQREVARSLAGAYIAAQVTGANVGVILAHASFGFPLVSVSSTIRDGFGRALAEVVSTFVLVLLIGGMTRTNRTPLIPWTVGLWVATAILATSSTGFANPAVTLARAFTDTYAGIAPRNLPAFVVAQLLGALLALAVTAVSFPTTTARPASRDRKETLV
jgi:glycerol uptake facilitator-like aquaporin